MAMWVRVPMKPGGGGPAPGAAVVVAAVTAAVALFLICMRTLVVSKGMVAACVGAVGHHGV